MTAGEMIEILKRMNPELKVKIYLCLHPRSSGRREMEFPRLGVSRVEESVCGREIYIHTWSHEERKL